MPFDPEWTFRDCPWCGLRDAQMRQQPTIEASRLKGPTRHWTLLSCPRCGGLISIEHTGPNAQTSMYRVVPEHGADVRVAHLPDDVREYYQGAIRVLEAGVPDAAAVQLRRTLEAAAAHHGIDKGALVQRIQGLIKAGLITKDFGRVLDHIREVGNVGAHASDVRVDEPTARRALLFTTQVLRNLFEIPAELDVLATQAAADESASDEA